MATSKVRVTFRDSKGRERGINFLHRELQQFDDRSAYFKELRERAAEVEPEAMTARLSYDIQRAG